MLVANIFTMLGSKNRWYSPALPLQHYNLQFLDIFEIGVAGKVGKKVDFKNFSHGVF